MPNASTAGQDCRAGLFTVCTTSAGAAGNCGATTRNAPSCQANASAICAACATDADRVSMCGADAACLVYAGCTALGVQTAAPH